MPCNHDCNQGRACVCGPSNPMEYPMIEKIRQRLNSKTYLTALALALITALEAQLQFFSGFVPPEFRPWLVMVWPAAMLTLRELTKEPLDSK